MAATTQPEKHVPGVVHHQYEDLEQQRETYIIGMWAFLVTEIMMFGAVALAFVYYKLRHGNAFYEAAQNLDWRIGAINTVVLLTSSYLMATAVYKHQQKDNKATNLLLCAVQLCAAAFLVIKIFFEWLPKDQHNLVPWKPFFYKGAEASSEVAHLFFNLYFGMTGLHGLHVLVGMLVIGAWQLMILKKNLHTRDYIHTEMIGLYWHFVDIVWIFLYPVFYLMPKP